MKIAKCVFAAITIIFGALGIIKLIPYSVSQPITFTSLAVLLALSAKGYKDNGDAGSAYMVYALAAVIILLVIYNFIF